MDKPFHKCRLCLKLGDFCSIFERDETVKLSDMVMSIANIKIFEGDGFSDRVCSACIENISTSYIFKLQCEKTDYIIRNADIENRSPKTGYDDFLTKEFYMHARNDSIECENDENTAKDIPCNRGAPDTEDDTDSDIDSVKCLYCNEAHNNMGMHQCHVTCTIEHNKMQMSSSNETLVSAETLTPKTNASLQYATPLTSPNETFVTANNMSSIMSPSYITPPTSPPKPPRAIEANALSSLVSCILCDDKFDQYTTYAAHLNKCTANVKLHHFVCPLCHEIFSDKDIYLEHSKIYHFKVSSESETGYDCVDFSPRIIKTSRPKAVRRTIGWSTEDIYQEIECVKLDQKPTPSPLKSLFSKFSNESSRSSSKQSTPKKVTFRQLIENGKAKTSVYLPFRKYIDNYKQKKKFNGYSPITEKMQVTGKVRTTFPPEIVSDSDYTSPSGTSEESWKLKQNLICACDKKVFMLSESMHDRDRIVAMINELGGVVAENTKMEMMATHFISVLPKDTLTGMMVCSLATGKWLLHIGYIYDSFRSRKFLNENLYEWIKHPKILEIDNTSVEVAKAAVYWHNQLNSSNAKLPFEGKQVVLVMKKKYRQYYQMIFKTLKAKPITYDPRTPGSCCNADCCFVDMKVIERVKLKFFASHNVPVFPYQYILVYLLNRGIVQDEDKYLLNENQNDHSMGSILSNLY